MFTGWMVFLKATKGMFTTRELSWTELNWPATSQPSYTTRSLVMCVSITAWLAAAKLGRLVFNQFMCYDMSTPTKKHVFRTPVNKLQFGSVQFACWEIHAGGMAQWLASLYERSHATSDRVSTWMGDSLWASIPSRFVVWPTMSCFADKSKLRHYRMLNMSAVDGAILQILHCNMCNIAPSRECNIALWRDHASLHVILIDQH